LRWLAPNLTDEIGFPSGSALARIQPYT